MRMILASASPRRRELLEQMGFEFEIIPSLAQETITKKTPQEAVMELARQKAEEVAARVEGSACIIGADTIVVHKDQILGKPRDEKDASEMIRALADDTHQVYTGVCLILKEGSICNRSVFAERTDVTFYPMSDREIDAYIACTEPSADESGPAQKRIWSDKAGGYGIQDPRCGIFIQKIEGDYYNVVGLPVGRLYHELNEAAEKAGLPHILQR